MSITLSVAQLCKHVLKISVDDFETRKLRGDYKKNNLAPVKAAVAQVWMNLEKLFPSAEQIVKENVTKTKMRDSVRSLLTAKTISSIVLFTFTEGRETRKGEKYLAFHFYGTSIVMKSFRYHVGYQS